MNHVDKPELEELLSSYIDDELSERQRTQVKRLIGHDEKIAEALRRLQKQKELLAALPAAPAPGDMLNSVKAAVERKAVSVDTDRVKTHAVASRRIYTQRLSVSAAMILAPVGILAWVVWTIIMPLSTPGGPTAPLVSGGDPAVVMKSPGISFPLIASLQLTTPQVISMGDFINKAIYKYNLVNFTTDISAGDASKTYTITASREQIVDLLRDLAGVWDKCDSTALTVHGRTMSAHSRVENITPQQAISLYQVDIFDDPFMLAGDFDRMNRILRSMPGYGIIETGPMTLIEQPTMTGPPQKDQPQQTDAAGNATLFITITAP
ncbi:MAG: hypothetical protein DRP66_11215 [Planctomycetota bacterium]|nr:MAG: hypothetical protein DRP66_11215 [Planctomycetota bacterium]